MKNRPQTAEISFLKIKLRKLSFQFFNVEVSPVRVLENQYPKFSVCYALHTPNYRIKTYNIFECFNPENIRHCRRRSLE